MSKNKATHDAGWFDKASGKSQPTHEANFLERASGKSQATHDANLFERASGKSQPTHKSSYSESLSGKSQPVHRSGSFGLGSRGGSTAHKDHGGSDHRSTPIEYPDYGDWSGWEGESTRSSGSGCVKWIGVLVVIAVAYFGIRSLSGLFVSTVRPPTVASAVETQPNTRQITSPTVVPTVATLPAKGTVNTAKLNVRKGPGIDYAILTQITEGTEVALRGRKPDGVWWSIELSNGTSGWVNGKYVDLEGCLECMPVVVVPAPAAQTPEAAMQPTATASIRQPIASNRGILNGEQGYEGWKYLMESARNSGVWQEMTFDGTCFRSGTWENDVRICANGEVHPGLSTRIAYEWRPVEPGEVVVNVHVHKIDTSCGDGIWVGIYHVRDGVGVVNKLGEFLVAAADNTGKTETYKITLDVTDMLYVIVDIHGDSTCDLSRVLLDLEQP